MVLGQAELGFLFTLMNGFLGGPIHIGPIIWPMAGLCLFRKLCRPLMITAKGS